MIVLGAIERSWAQLWAILNFIKDAINQRTPYSGDGIMVTESSSGFVIALKRDPAQQEPTFGIKDEGSTANWQSLTVIDSTDCSQKYIWYWGTAPVASQTSKPPTSHPISTSESGSFIPVTKK